MTPTPADSSLQAAILPLTTDPLWISDVASVITAAIHAELGLPVDLQRQTEITAESVLHQFAEMVGRSEAPDHVTPPPQAVEYVREFVVRGVPLDNMVRAYHIGHATFFERWVATVRSGIDDPQMLAAVIEQGALWTFRYLQALTRDLIKRYAEERERWVRNAASLRSETVRAVLAGEDLDVQSASRRLGYHLNREHVAFVVWSEDADRDDRGITLAERQASELASTLGARNVLLVPLGGQVIAGWMTAIDAAAAGSLAIDAPLQAAVGEPGDGVDGFRRSHRQALSARRVASLADTRPGTVTRFADVAMVALASVDEQTAREFVATELGPLAERDDATLRLAATLRAYLEEHASPRRTASRLGVHENTINYRVKTIEELRGRPAGDRVAETLLALRLARVVDPDRP